MKKITVLALLISMSLFANAQNLKIKYQSEIIAGYSFGIGALPLNRISIQTVQGVRLNDYFSLGLGLGLDYITELYEDAPELTLPIYLNTKGYLPVSEKCKLFLSVDIGVSVGLTAGVTGMKGLLFVPAVGVSIKDVINIGLGYNYQAWSESGLTVNTDAITLRVAYQF